jgi:methionyl aminopeptidase
MKIDFGVNINGQIIDSAFTVCFDDKFTPLLEGSREGTRVGIRTAGIDIKGKYSDIKRVANLSGHLLKLYMIHAAKFVPLMKGGLAKRMKESELYACETFGTRGKGRVNDTSPPLSHFMVNPNPTTPRTPQHRKLLKMLQDNFWTLAFCPSEFEVTIGVESSY